MPVPTEKPIQPFFRGCPYRKITSGWFLILKKQIGEIADVDIALWNAGFG